MTQPDWLDIPATQPAPANDDWLSLETVAADLPDYLKIRELDTASIQVDRAGAQLKDIRFQVMQGTNRVWATNGRYVACRPVGFNPTTVQRHGRFLASGHYKHVGTYDDVQLFELLPSSPFYRTEGDVRAGGWYELLIATVKAALARDWSAYVDLISEIATRIKSTAALRDTQGGVDTAWAETAYHNALDHLYQLIFMRWSHAYALVEDKDFKPGMNAMTYSQAFQQMQFEIERGVHEIRKSRGEKSSVLTMPPRQGPLIIR